ncbi:hypothetical protein LguiA_008688 [Lonicera macranthoides]
MGQAVEICVEQITSEGPTNHHQNSAIKSKVHHSLQIIERAMRVSDIHSASVRMEECSLELDLNQQREANPQEAWLPITESRKGNFFSSLFLLLSSGIGIQALLLPAAFVALGWFWGILCLTLAFIWQLYTIWILVHLHESVPGTRYSRFLDLSIAAFGEKLGKMISIFPVMYLSGGTCVMLIIIGGGIMKRFHQVLCGDEAACIAKSPTGAEWYLIFMCSAILVAQFCPNLNSVAGVSLLGAIMAVGYCTLVWALSVSKGRPDGVSYDPSKAAGSKMDRVRGVLNALGIIALAFRGHNVVLEIQGTIPSNDQQPSHKLMWRGVTTSYLLIALCIFPLALVGYWVYGNTIITNGRSLLVAFSTIYGDKIPKFLMGAIYLLVIINCITTFQIYAMVVFDSLEMMYTGRKNRPCPRWVRSGFRFFFGGFAYFVSVALPFLGSLAAFIGGIMLPLTLSYPCFMWIAIKKPSHSSKMWCINMGLGCLGLGLSVVLVGAALWDLIVKGIDANFFNP